MSRRSAARLRAALLLAPLVLFLAVFFVWPLASVLTTAVRNESVAGAFPGTAAAMSGWDGAGLPGPEIEAALLADLRAVDRRTLGGAVGRLNAAVPGFRSLISATAEAARSAPENASPALASIDPRWEERAYWTTIRSALRPYTDRNLLAAFDLGRDEAGSIAPLAPEASANRVILWRTFTISATITLCCLVLGLPYALIAASVSGWRRNAMLVAVLLPLWTSLLVRTAAWYIVLQDNGVVNDVLLALGVIEAPLPLIFNRVGVVIAMTHVLLPFMVLPIYTVLITIPRTLMPAAASLGAHPWTAFRRVLLPLAMPGVLSGVLLVFMVAIGYYITPALLGGPGDQMISGTIAFYALETANWSMAGALGIILLGATLVLYALYGRFSRSGSPMGM